MSLRLRLLLLMIGMVAALSLLMLGIQINSLISVWLGHTAERAASTAQFVKSYVMERAQERASSVQPPPPDLNSQIRLWRAAIIEDDELPGLLSSTLTQTRSIVEISVAGERGRILASSNPERNGKLIGGTLPIKSLADLNPLDRFLQVLRGQMDYETRVDLGVPGQKEPVFTIQVLVSSALLRDAIVPEVSRTAFASLPLFVFSILIAWVAAQLALRPLAGISQTIDQITRGETMPEHHLHVSSTRELAAVQEKLRFLGEQFRGAQMGATQLRGSVERLLERLEEAIFLFDASGRLIVCGEPVERLLNMKRTDITRRKIEELFPGTMPVGAAIASAVVDRRPLRDTQIGRLMLNLDFLPDGALLLRIRDAEGRQMVEKQLSLSTRLAAINRLTGGVAHEIKNPLNSIALRLELLRSRVLPEVPEANGEIEVIAQEITRLDRVVRTFLDFTRPLEMRTRDCDLGGLASESLELIRPQAELIGIKVESNGLDHPVAVRVDDDLIKQVLMNLLSNAMEAMPQGGHLQVNLRNAGREAILDISDTGPGIPLEMREKIFQLYYTTKEKGTGIGLAMAYRAMQMHDGGIEVGGGEGRGTTFRLRFPVEVGADA